ncbi:MAG: hypothetical protein ACYC9Z_04240 [Casimicrobiaceae bacterium]
MDALVSTDDNGVPTGEPTQPQAPTTSTEAAEGAAAAAVASPPAAAPGEALTLEQHDAAINSVMPEADRDRLVAQIVAKGGLDNVHLNQRQGNLAPEQFQAHAAGVQSALQNMADQYVAAQGVDQQAFYEYVRAKGSGVMNSTGLLMFHARNPEMALAPLLAEFKRTAAGRKR